MISHTPATGSGYRLTVKSLPVSAADVWRAADEIRKRHASKHPPFPDRYQRERRRERLIVAQNRALDPAACRLDDFEQRDAASRSS